MYGKVLETPQNENTPFNPISPYAAAKLYAYYMVKCYRDGYDMFAVNGILFNHESPRRGKNFLTMKVINAVKEISTGKKEYIELGNLDSKRDWGHARDYVKGMWQMLQQDKPGDFVLATGKTYTVREFVEKSFSHKGFNIRWQGVGTNEIGIDQNGITRIKINEKYYRPCEVDLLLGDASKAEKELNWSRDYDTLDKLIKDMFDN
jgi:GDPmannose 4,6-dehydratase